MVSPSFHLHKPKDKNIDRPIFFTGFQGGGLTLVSRMIRRRKGVVSVTGGHKYWAGADEMQNVFGPYLNKRLSGIKHHVPYHNDFPSLRGWMYACNSLIGRYRLSNDEYYEEDEYKLKKIISWCVGHYGSDEENRFVDKSQVYTVKSSYIGNLLSKYNPIFVCVLRNPYAICYRAPFKSISLRRLNSSYSFYDKIKIASEHWKNSVESSLNDSLDYDIKFFKLEDILKKPHEELKKMCKFIDIPFCSKMIPSSRNSIPFGSMRRERWFPLRKSINHKYLSKIDSKSIKIIDSKVGHLSDKFNYSVETK